MARQIRWLNQALRELYYQCQLVEKRSSDKSARLEEEAFQAVEILKDFPQLGKLVPNSETEHRALLIFGREYWIVYRYGPRTITIAAVIWVRQDFAKAWKSRKRT